MEGNSMMDKFAWVSARIGRQRHLLALRDTFAALLPLFILAGVAVLFNNVFFPAIMSGDMLEAFQYWGNALNNGTLNIAGLAVAPVSAFMLARNRRDDNPISVAIVAFMVFFVMLPRTIEVTSIDGAATVSVLDIITYANLGTKGIFTGAIVGLVSAESLMALNRVKFLQINLGDNIPPQVAKSFSSLLPSIIVLSAAGIISSVLAVFGTDFGTLVATFIQAPFTAVGMSLPGYVLLVCAGNLAFSFGIHQSSITGALVDPMLLSNMADNMAAFNAGKEIPNIICSSFGTVYGGIGGSGSTICLIIAILLFNKVRSSRSIAKLAIAPGIFGINEPVIFGYPIVYNLPMIIPFVLTPAIGIVIGYFATALGLVSPCVVQVPWTSPPIVSALIATAGDWRTVVLQLIVIAIGVLVYLPFMRISERAAQLAQEEASAE